jgi:hypothetical protein
LEINNFQSLSLLFIFSGHRGVSNIVGVRGSGRSTLVIAADTAKEVVNEHGEVSAGSKLGFGVR